MVIYIDFDRTIHDIDSKPPDHALGPPMWLAKEVITGLKGEGHTIIIFTVRATEPRSIKVVADWMKHFNIPYHDITNIKGKADVYIDDKALRFRSWDKVLEQLYE